MSGSVKRQYRSPRREAAAAETRAQIRAAAAALFVERGYVATTMRDVAKLAGVGERTLYDTFTNKPRLFRHTLGVATAGDEQRVRVADRPEVHAVYAEPDPAVAIARWSGYNVDLLERAGDLIMVSIEAADTDADMRAQADAGSAEFHQVCLTFARTLHERGALRDGLDAAAAADLLYALSSPHMHQLLRRHRQWSLDRFRTWAARTLIAQLLG
jgi:AcrR family transcriptional regulator